MPGRGHPRDRSLPRGGLERCGGGGAPDRRRNSLIDVLPDVPGLAAHWGRGAIHCPYCHGWEVRDQALVVIDTGFGAHQAALFRQVTSDLTLVVHTGDGPDDDAVARLTARGVGVVREPVAEVLSGGGGDVVGVRLVGGSVIPAAAVVVGPRVVARTAGVTSLGLASVPDAMGVGEVIETDPAGKTAVAGVYAAGNVADVKGQVLQAAAAGAVVGATVNADLVAEDTDDALERDTAAHEWDERYLARAHLGSDRPGEELVARASRLAPGRALDVGCGEGTDARWLASKGWETTGLDVSQVALDRAAALAGDAGVAVGWVCGDLTTAALDDRGYDLVAVRDPHLRRTDDGAVETALVGAVAPGGTLVFVGHASLDPERARPHGFDPADHVQPADIVARLDETWDVLVDETRPRVTASPHDGPWTHDAVLSVRRHPRG